MSTRITDLNEALASRARKEDHLRDLDRPTEPEPARPRLAERIVTLRPLTQHAVSVDPDPEPKTGLLALALSDGRRFERRVGDEAYGHVSSSNALVPYREQTPGRVASSRTAPSQGQDRAAAEEKAPRDYQALLAFAIGLVIAAAIGIALYSQMV